MIRGFLWSPTVKKYIKSVRQIQSKPKIKVCKWSPNWLWAAGGSGWCCEDKYEKDAKDKYEKDGKDKYRKDAGTNIRLEEVRKWGSAPGQTERGLLATQNSWHPCLNIILLPLYVLTLYLPYTYLISTLILTLILLTSLVEYHPHTHWGPFANYAISVSIKSFAQHPSLLI